MTILATYWLRLFRSLTDSKLHSSVCGIMQERLSRLFVTHGGQPDLGDGKTTDTLRALLRVLEVWRWCWDGSWRLVNACMDC